jgi:hypothetical protein
MPFKDPERKRQYEREYMRRWRREKPEKFQKILQRFRERHPNWQKEKRHRIRMQALIHYGGNPPKCACCGESHVEFLAIDHVDGRGNEHRRKLGYPQSGEVFYYWLRRNNYPPGYRVLCHNCNMAIGLYGYCPHATHQ